MITFSAYVRTPNDFVVKTQVVAENIQQAIFLLQGQYGVNNVVHLPAPVA